MDIFTLGSGRLRIGVCPIGARLNEVAFDGITGLVASTSTREDALGAHKNHGAVVGPVANRLANATAEIAGKTYHFDKNENGITTLHGGKSGVNRSDWSVDAQEQNRISFTLALPDGHGGFPGNRMLQARYTVTDASFTVTLKATTDAPTILSLALHPYWTLARQGRAGQALRVAASRYLPIDDLKIPTGEIADVSGTRYDLRTLAEPAEGIDHNLCLDPAPMDGVSATLAARDIRLDILTDAPGMQVFTGKDLGIALEPQHWPDAPHHPEFPSIRLDPGEAWRQKTEYRFTRL